METDSHEMQAAIPALTGSLAARKATFPHVATKAAGEEATHEATTTLAMDVGWFMAAPPAGRIERPAGQVSAASPDMLADTGCGSLHPQRERTRLGGLVPSP